MLLLLSIVVAVVYYVTLYPVDNPVPGEYEVVGSEKGTSEAGSEKRSEASPESEGAGSEFEGAPVPVPIYLVGPVEVRDMKEKGEDSKQSKGRSERSTRL
uniref:Uncharacterized protein n=1 Tax=Meloidogyne enterolobii TaxID=390850 RepID=A0A6V7TKG7_MELEN|nr:unnamed protein product [Meloidogyne enterolobii]